MPKTVNLKCATSERQSFLKSCVQASKLNSEIDAHPWRMVVRCPLPDYTCRSKGFQTVLPLIVCQSKVVCFSCLFGPKVTGLWTLNKSEMKIPDTRSI